MLKIDLTGKIALITGATGQLGRVMARTLAGCGAKVAIHYMNNEAKAQELLDEITAAGGSAMIVQGDVTKEASTVHMKKEIRENLGDPDIVAANAVVQYDWMSVLEQPASDYVSQFESCVLQSVFLAKAFIPAMMEKNTDVLSGSTPNARCRISRINRPTRPAKEGWTAYTAYWPKRSASIKSPSTRWPRAGRSASGNET